MLISVTIEGSWLRGKCLDQSWTKAIHPLCQIKLTSNGESITLIDLKVRAWPFWVPVRVWILNYLDFSTKKKDYNIFPTMILIDASLRVENENKNCGHHKIIKLFAPAVSCLKNPLQWQDKLSLTTNLCLSKVLERSRSPCKLTTK